LLCSPAKLLEDVEKGIANWEVDSEAGLEELSEAVLEDYKALQKGDFIFTPVEKMVSQ
jgi:hypothetical protein